MTTQTGPVVLTPGQEDLLRRAGKLEAYKRSFELFAENELFILTKSQELKLFKLHEFQRYLNWKMDEQEKREGFIRQVWLKHRQPGGSTLAQGKVFQRTAIRRNVSSIVVAHDIATTQSIFNITKRFHENLPAWLKPQLRYSTKTEFEFNSPKPTGPPGMGSKIVIATARNVHSGAGQTFHNAHLSEAARYQNAQEIDSSILRAVSLVPRTMVIVESTAQPSGHWFYNLCDEARKGQSPYEFHFIGWQMDPTCQLALQTGESLEMTVEESELVDAYGLDASQIKWRRYMIGSMSGDMDRFHQEYPMEPDEAWIVHGSEVFPTEQMRIVKQGLAPPKVRGDMQQGARFMQEGDGPLEIWEHPVEGAFYDIGADVALGQTEEGDYSAAVVTKRPTGEQVALYRSHIEPGMFADFLTLLGYYYNTAQIACEINGVGLYTNARLSERYANLYLWRRRDEVGHVLTRKTGWETSHRSKSLMVALGRDRVFRYVTSDEPKAFALIKSQQLYDEMRFFMKGDDGNSWAAAPGWNDDCVMAWLIAQVANDDETYGLGSHDQLKPTETVVESKGPMVQEPVFMGDDEVAARTRGRGVGIFDDLAGWRYR